MTKKRLSLYQISGFNKTLAHYTQAGTKSLLLNREGLFVVLWVVCFRFKRIKRNNTGSAT